VYIIIVGGGRLGFKLAQSLLAESHEVLVIDKRPELVERIIAEMGSMAMVGDGCEGKTLEEAGASRADVFIALTSEDEDNLVACQIARHRYKIARTVARVMDERSETLFRTLGIDTIINSTSIILEHIMRELPFSPLSHLFESQEPKYEIVMIKIASASAVIGKTLSEIGLPKGTMIPLIIRQGAMPFSPHEDSRFAEGDRIIAVTRPEDEPFLNAVFAAK
jgi:trk system potassium uptake protein TrkA